MDSNTLKIIIDQCCREYDKLGKLRERLDFSIKELREMCPHDNKVRRVVKCGFWYEEGIFCDVCGKCFDGV